ncbi:MAG: hypothetical protein JXB39_04430 [Deltaproteobacteria bacterium]|nr:hypothetical protein [Deltaproteobacteria bacterium]
MSTSHDVMVASGLLRGHVDDRSIARWPEWAREHVATCPICRALLQLQPAPDAAFETLAPLEPLTPPPQPSLEELAARASKRFHPKPGDLLAFAPSFPSVDGQSFQMEIMSTPTGYRVWHPLAYGIAVFGIPPRSPPRVIASEGSEEPGISIEFLPVPEDTSDLLAVATRGPIDVDLWRMFLADWLQSGPDDFEVPSDPKEHVHFARLHLGACRG